METRPSPDEKLRALRDWVTSSGGYLHESVELVSSGSDPRAGSSAKTTASLPANTCIITCPHELSLDYAKAQKSFPPSVVSSINHHAFLYTFLCQQKLLGKDSFWWPYINTLPQDLSTPLFFTDEDMEFLRGCNLSETEVSLRRQIWTAEWRAATAAMKEAGMDTTGYTWELFLWAATIFTSRSFPGKLQNWTGTERHGIPIADTTSPDELPVLFPLIDLLNHRPLAKVTWVPAQTTFSLVVGEKIAAGSELLNNYGPKSNEELLMGYGFTIPSNPFDHVTLRFSPQISPAQAAIRAHQLHPDRPGIYELFPSNTPIIPVSLTLLFRILTANTLEARLLTAKPDASQIYIRNSLAAYTQLYLSIARKLSGLSPDPGPPKNPRQESAKVYRDTQKAILEMAAKEAQETLAKLMRSDTAYTLQRALDDDELFAQAVEACFGTSDATELAGNQDENAQDMSEIAFVLFLAWKFIASSSEKWKLWFSSLEPVYGTVDETEAGDEITDMYADIFAGAPKVAPAIFGAAGWSPGLLEWARAVYAGQGVEVPGVGWVICVETV